MARRVKSAPGDTELLAASDGNLDWVFWVATTVGLLFVVSGVRERRAGD